MFLDLSLAVGHHLLMFLLLAILVCELAFVREGISGKEIKRIALIDLGYGLIAMLLVLVGFSRAIFATKGWAYYSVNMFFWAKIGIFVLIGILSIWPTVQFIGWQRRLKANGELPNAGAVTSVRRVLLTEAGLFVLLPIFAAAMARGYGV